VDLYRIGSEEELLAAGFLDLLEPGAVVAVEWADRFPGALPADRLRVRIERADPEGGAGDGRALSAVASGQVSRAVLARWRGALAPAVPEG
jgi:tRNA threonylcarbamoyladenosine biosynthesis protein TsaE